MFGTGLQISRAKTRGSLILSIDHFSLRARASAVPLFVRSTKYELDG